MRLRIDARCDERNIWYAFMQTRVSDFLYLKRLKKPSQGVRIEAKVRRSHALRCVILYLPVLGKIGYHDNLMKFDLSEADRWYIISMTLSNLPYETGDTILGQVSMMDWGNTDIYTLDVDYDKVKVVDWDQVAHNQGNAVRYRPPLADPATFSQQLQVN